MKAKRIEVVSVNISWDCGNKKHNHTTEEIAQACIDNRLRVKSNIGKDAANNKPRRNLEMMKHYNETRNYSKTGREFGVRGEQVKSVLLRFLKDAAESIKEKYGLNCRYVEVIDFALNYKNNNLSELIAEKEKILIGIGVIKAP